MMAMGLFVDVLRPARGAATNGVSAIADRVLLTGPGIPGVFEAGDSPVFHLSLGPLGHVVAKPAGSEGRALMFSGAFLYTSDSRFSAAVRGMNAAWDGWTVPVFDRDEGLFRAGD